jgi:hypothetical protein
MPAVVVSYVSSYRPAYRLTSVDVPPTSRLIYRQPASSLVTSRTYPMIGLRSSSSQLVNAYPTTPPAGPLRMLFNPLKLFKSSRPPSLPMNSTLGPSVLVFNLGSKPLKKPSRYDRSTGVRYASAVLLTPRGTSRIIGSKAALSLTCVNPMDLASRPTSCSC